MNSSTITENATLDAILATLGFIRFDVIAYQFALPTMCAISIVLCTLNVRIFFSESFNKPADHYFKLITLMYVTLCVLGVPYGFCFTPTYFPRMDSHVCAIFQSVYIAISMFMFHYTSILEIAILLERMKIFSAIVKKYFTIAPKKACILFFFVCIPINTFFAFVFVPISGGDYFYVSKEGAYEQNTFWFVGTSHLANSYAGQKLLISVYIVRDIFTMITSVTLNLTSLIQMRRYFKKRSMLLSLQSNGIMNKVTRRELKLQQTERDHLHMVITLCSIVVVSRSVVLATNIYYLFSVDFIATLLGTFTDLLAILGPITSFFVFYRFNKKFRREFRKMVCLVSSRKTVLKSTTNNDAGQ